MHLSYLTPSKRTYTLGILTVTAGMLLSCNTTPMTAMTEEGHSFGTQDTFHDGMVILESVPSGEGSIREVPGEVVIVGTADGSRTDACSDSISPSELASIERRVSLDAVESVWTDPVRDNPRTAIQEERKSAATKIQSVARMYNSNAAARATIQEDLPHPNRGQQSDLIKLSAVGASAFALGGYVNQSFFNQQREEEAQTAREGATIRIRQLEEQLAAAEAAKRLQTAVDLYSQPAAEAEGLLTAVDFYNHTATLNNNTSCQFPDFFNQSCLLSAHPGWMKAAPLGMSAFLVGGYVAQKVRRSYNALHKQLETTTTSAKELQEKLTSEKETRAREKKERQEVEGQLDTSREEKRAVDNQLTQTEGQLDTSREEKRAVDDQLTQTEGQLTASTTNAVALQGQLTASIAEREVVQGQLAASTTNADNLQGQLTESIASADNLQGQLTESRAAKDDALANVGEFLSKLDTKVLGKRNKEHWVVPVLINSRHESYYTQQLFLKAVNNGFAQVVEALLQNSPELINSSSGIFNDPVLHQAARKGHDAVLGVLLANNADVNKRSVSVGNSIVGGIISMITPYSAGGNTALHEAAQNGHDAAVRVLLDNGSDVNARDDDGHAALHVAARVGRSTIVQTLLNKEGIEVNAENNRGKTALQHVLERYPEEERSDSMNRVMELLRNAGAR